MQTTSPSTETVEYTVEKWPAILGIIMLLLLLLPWPYGFYVFGKWVITPIAIYYAYTAYKQPRAQDVHVALFVLMALLFNPFYYVPLGREAWQVVNVIGAAYLYWFPFSEN
jgi:hypothetical protein